VVVVERWIRVERGRTHCRHCAHSPARPLAGWMSTATAVQQQQQQRPQQQEAGREGSGLVKQLADRLPCALWA
jgi:hypothetical protein